MLWWKSFLDTPQSLHTAVTHAFGYGVLLAREVNKDGFLGGAVQRAERSMRKPLLLGDGGGMKLREKWSGKVPLSRLLWLSVRAERERGVTVCERGAGVGWTRPNYVLTERAIIKSSAACPVPR